MKQLMYLKKRTLQWHDVAEPVLKEPGDVIVRPLAAARCDGDKLFLLNDGPKKLRAGLFFHMVDPVTTQVFGSPPFDGPFPIGHECVAEVMSCGESVSSFSPGDRVIVPWSISCGSCSHCHLGLTSRCSDAGDTLMSAYGFGKSTGEWGGMVSDLLRVPYADHMLVKVPEGIAPSTVASASDNIPDGWRMVAPILKTRPGAPALILGGSASSIGLYAAAIAVALGSSEVDYVDNDKQRLLLAEKLGANPVEISGNRERWFRRHGSMAKKYPIVADCVVNDSGLQFGIRSLAAGGVCTSVGYYFRKTTSLPLMAMFANDSTFHTGVSHPRASLPEVLDLIKGGKFKPEMITTTLAPWNEAHDAFLDRGVKVVIERPSLFL
jgi:threonine dehydrogenase-like Zn-dependent dehydrogenase